MMHRAWNSKEEMPYCFPRSSIKFQGHTGQNVTDFDPNWAFSDYRPVAAFKSLRFALLTAGYMLALLAAVVCWEVYICQAQAFVAISNISSDDISKVWCKTTVSPLLMQWRYCSLVLSHQYSKQHHKFLMSVVCDTLWQTVNHIIVAWDLSQADTTWHIHIPSLSLCCTEFIIVNISIYLYFLSVLNIEIVQVVEILPRGRQGPV